MTKKTWTEQFKIRTIEMNSRGKPKIQALLNLFQESAIMHANHMGLGFNDMIKQNYAWVLSHLYIKTNTAVENLELLKVKTWPCGVNRIFALRDFDILSRQNTKIAAGSSRWLAIDIQSRRLARNHNYFDIVHSFSKGNKNRYQFAKLPQITQWNHEKRFRVRYSDLDINQHVNNINYIEWVVESMPQDIILKKDISSMEIHFLSEALFGDTIVSRSTAMENKGPFFHSIINETSGKELIRARTIWA